MSASHTNSSYSTRPAIATLQPSLSSSISSPSTNAHISTSSSSTSLASASSAALSPSMPATTSHHVFTTQQPQQPQRHPSFSYLPNRDAAGSTASETTAYLNQAGLLAEAAKRAQMAVVMRDIEGMEL